MRVRIKSTGMTMLGMEDGSDARHGGGRNAVNEPGDRESPASTPDVPNPVKLLKGLFGG